MAKFTKELVNKEVERLKRVFEKILTPKKEKGFSQLILQPIKNKNI